MARMHGREMKEEEAVQGLWEQGRVAWPGLPLDLETFGAFLRDRVGKSVRLKERRQ